VFGAPRRLDLRLVCTDKKPVRKMLDIWPTSLPIAVRVFRLSDEIEDDVVAALEQCDRVYEIHKKVLTEYAFETLANEMRNEYLALTRLDLLSASASCVLRVPDSDTLLGGSAPRLRSLRMVRLDFPALPKLLSSPTGLVCLRPEGIPDTGYTPPEQMADFVSSMTGLEELRIQFLSSLPFPFVDRRPSLLTCSVLPVLTTLVFGGVHEYLDRLFTNTNAPVLTTVRLDFFENSALVFDISQISPFIGRTEGAFKQVYMHFRCSNISVTLSSQTGTSDGKMFILSVTCRDTGWWIWSLTQSPRQFTDREWQRSDVQVPWYRLPPFRVDDMGNVQWLALFHFLTTVEDLYLSEGLAECVAPALGELDGERVMEVLPALQHLFIERFEFTGSVRQPIGKFVAARQRSGHPIAVHWEA